MKRLFIPTLVVLTILLTACGASATSTPANTTTNELPIATQLVLGSIKLDDTEYVITSEQATELLPMWQVYAELVSSDTAAQAEINALAEQIQESMTTDQMQTISDMQLTQQDIFTAMQEANTFANTSQSSSNITIPSGSSNSNGGMPAGGPADGGGGTPPDMAGGSMPSDFGGIAPDMSAGETQNAQAGSGQAGTVSAVPTPLIQMLVESLQQKIVS